MYFFRSFTLTALSCSLLTAADEAATDYWVRVMPAAWFASISGDTSYGINGIGGTNRSFADLGLDNNEANFSVEAGGKLPILVSLHLGAFQQETDGNFSTSAFTYGDQAFTTGSSDMLINDIYVEADLRPLDLDIAGIAIGLAWHAQHAELSLSDGGTSAGLDEDYQFPALALRGHVNLPVLLSLGAEAKIHWMEISIDGTQVRYFDATAQITYMPWDMFGFLAGYRILENNVRFKDLGGNANGKINLSIAGPFIGLVGKF